jgi:hypothetical protein
MTKIRLNRAIYASILLSYISFRNESISQKCTVYYCLHKTHHFKMSNWLCTILQPNETLVKMIICLPVETVGTVIIPLKYQYSAVVKCVIFYEKMKFLLLQQTIMMPEILSEIITMNFFSIKNYRQSLTISNIG